MASSSSAPPAKCTKARANRYSDADNYILAARNAHEFRFSGRDYRQVRWTAMEQRMMDAFSRFFPSSSDYPPPPSS
ncbi:hypothetical protein RIF29_29864 [Crotalaria pallida]|uniref:Uncharacterized protein n=1 Tax=Crotalaria pallida TaxID=3830 RepID=A0AAN9HU96_CROPI